MKKRNLLHVFGLSLALVLGSCTSDDETSTDKISSSDLSSKSSNSTELTISATTASTQYSSTYAASKATDGSLSTRWTASGTVYLYLDLGSSQLIDYVKVAHYKGNQRAYSMKFHTSDSLTGTWTLVGTKTSPGTTSELYDYDLTNSTARYVRVTCTGNTVNEFSDITEIEVYGTSSSTTTTTTSSYPAGVLGITASTWKINSHTGSPSDSTYWDDITDSGATYSTYSNTNYFYTDGTWTYFKCWRGLDTSSSSSNPRVELREMSSGDESSWDGSSGTNTMTWTVRVDRLPNGSDGSTGTLCFGQIHGPSENEDGVEVDDIIRVQFYGTANQTSGSVKLKISGYITEDVLGSSQTISGYELGTEYTFTLKYTSSTVYLYKGSTLVFSQKMDTSTEGNYFKVGNYLQSVKGSSYDGSYGLVAVKNLSVSH